MSNLTDKRNENLRAWYPFDDTDNLGRDASGNGLDAVLEGKVLPAGETIDGRAAVVLKGGENGTSYVRLPQKLLEGVGDETGFTVAVWVRGEVPQSPWERIFDFGAKLGRPYVFLTRWLRGVCNVTEDLAADPGRPGPDHTWNHVVFSVTGTKGGTLSSAGPRLYLNGELAGDGWISQTSSGTYKKLREWLETLTDPENYTENFIGRSQFPADPDFAGAISDFRVYGTALGESEVLALMCRSLAPEEILALAKDKYLKSPLKIINADIELADSLMDGLVSVRWESDHPEVLSGDGRVSPKEEPTGVRLTAHLSCEDKQTEKTYCVTVLSKETVPYEITVHGDRPGIDISPTLFGLFYEDINHAADGGIYAEMIQNRSFEEFHFDTYDFRSGENGTSTGRVREPLRYWFGEIDKAEACLTGGLNEHLGLSDPDANACYIKVKSGAKLYNHGFCDNTFACAMNFKAGAGYRFSVWARPEGAASVKVTLLSADDVPVSDPVTLTFTEAGTWKKYEAQTLIAKESLLGKIELEFDGDTAIDMVSLMPEDVWGAEEEPSSPSAHANFTGNPNYRLRRDLVETLRAMNPSFLRFPGGCISEGSFIWENVYDWKDSVGPAEVRKENFNVWGYGMTMGLGYMEYFQLAEDLGAEPLPVMACGVLCQARSDYANPAGGTLQQKYISNFTDLIDFAISTDFDGCKWAAIRRDMGHEAPFGLHYLGVGNENWGTEFYASFEAFKHAIDEHMKSKYPGYPLTIISTAGAQADDGAFQTGWRFLAGYHPGKTDRISFTDGKESFEQEVRWYPYQKNYLETIVDEHYYRSNDYLLENADRYNYYYRPYDADGKLIEDQVSKVFVGEYASSDKNTLAGAIAEAAVMTGFEKNSDVVRLAATAPLFNKVGADGTYRWTPDAIWFDDRTVWRTPTYYVQQLFASYLGTKLLPTSYETYAGGRKVSLIPRGGILLRAGGEDARFEELTVTDNRTGETLLSQRFDRPLDERLTPLPDGGNGYFLDAKDWHDYTVTLTAEKQEEATALSVGAGLLFDDAEGPNLSKASYFEYCVGRPGSGTGLRVVKDGREGYTMGDYSNSVYAGNLRGCFTEPVAPGRYTLTLDFGGADGAHLNCFYTDASGAKKAVLENKLESYNRDVFHSVTGDEEKIYVKLVNADGFDKRVSVAFAGVNVASEADRIVLTGDTKTAHRPNINTKEEEPVAPVKDTAAVEGGTLVTTVPANGLVVLVARKS